MNTCPECHGPRAEGLLWCHDCREAFFRHQHRKMTAKEFEADREARRKEYIAGIKSSIEARGMTRSVDAAYYGRNLREGR